MSRIKVEMPNEGDLAKKKDLTKSDTAWTSGAKNVSGENVREEGLDRRVISANAWTHQTGTPGGSGVGVDNFSSAHVNSWPIVNDTWLNVPPWSTWSGGMGGGVPRIQKKYVKDETQGILVRCSFKFHWNTLRILSNTTSSAQNYAGSRIGFRLARYSEDDGYTSPVTGDIAWVRLSRAYGSSLANDEMMNITHEYDRRSDMYASITLIDAFTPMDEWSSMPNRNNFRWVLQYYFRQWGGSSIGAYTADLEVDNINLVARKFRR